MRTRITTGIALAVALCAMCGLATSAFAFGEFEASITGQNLETTPGVLKVSHEEGSLEINGLELGAYLFGPINRVTGEQETETPCKSVKLSGGVNKPKSKELTFRLKFTKCVAIAEAGALEQEVATNFTLGVVLHSNFGGELGQDESSVELEPGVVKFKGALKKCPVIIPRQSLPAKYNPKRTYEEVVEFENESFEPEHIEHSKRLKELYPSGEKETLNVYFEEKVHHFHSYVSQAGPCTNVKGAGNSKIVTEGPYAGMLEYTNGHMTGEIEDIEVKNGNLKFNEEA
jgi:hypothetical protein